MRAWQKDKNRRAVAILRVSSRDQRDNTSLDGQEKDIRGYCAKHGLELVGEPFRLAESGKRAADRRLYREARDFALSKGCKHLLFYMQDRETRNLSDLEENEDLVQRGMIVVHYVRDDKVFDVDTPESDFMMRDVQGVINKQYSRVLSGKVTDAQRNKAESGWFPGGRPPLGYMHLRPTDEDGKVIKRAPTTVVPDTDQRKLRQIRREFELRASGLSLDAIRRKIIEEGFIPAAEVKGFRVSIVEWHLKNKFYYGKFEWDGVEYVGKHDLIIPEQHLAAVRESFSCAGRRSALAVGEAPFSGWLRCADPECGMRITFEKKRKTVKETGEAKVYRLYRCSNSRKVHDSLAGMYTDEEKIWEQFEPAIEQVDLPAQLAKDIADALNETHRKARKRIVGEMDGYRAALKAADLRNHEVFDLFLAKKIDESEYRRQLDPRSSEAS